MNLKQPFDQPNKIVPSDDFHNEMLEKQHSGLAYYLVAVARIYKNSSETIFGSRTKIEFKNNLDFACIGFGMYGLVSINGKIRFNIRKNQDQKTL